MERNAKRLTAALVLALAQAGQGAARAQAPEIPSGTASAVIDLATREGAALVRGVWRTHEARIVAVKHRAPDADGQPTGVPIETYDIAPRAGAAEFDDSAWEAIEPGALVGRRANGRLSFQWYRIAVTIPERIGDFDPTGATAVFQTTLDDYAEIWVDGEIPRGLGQRGGSVIAGWNAPNRLVVARDVRPGQVVMLAVFGANGPLSDPPANFIWMREARLELFREPARGPFATPPREVNVAIERLNPGLDAIVPANPKLWKLAEGFQFTEGPVWTPQGLVFSDPNANRIYRYTPDGTLSVLREQSGYAGADVAGYRQPGSNGLELDREGRLVVNEHGNRRVVRLEPDGRVTVVVDRFEGKRLNSPNDLVYRSDGTLFFTDPPFGLPKVFEDPRKEIPYSGVYAARNGSLRLLVRDLTGPNGIALSPDEKRLYVGNWDLAKKVVMRFDLAADGSVSNGRVFADLTQAPGEDAIDGVKTDTAGNVYVSGPGGLFVYDPDGRHLGTIRTPRHAHNFAWGDADGRTLYLTARDSLYRMPLRITGVR